MKESSKTNYAYVEKMESFGKVETGDYESL